MEHPLPLLRELLGQSLRRERHRQARTLAQVAERSGVSMQHLSDVERGIKDPSSEVVAAIAGALGLTVLDLAARVGEDPAGARIIDLTQHVHTPERGMRRADDGPRLALVSA